MSAQPESLRIADECEQSAKEWLQEVETRKQAAVELRRLHAENEALKKVAEAERESRQAAQIENEALKARIARADVELQRAVIAEREACAKVCDSEAARALANWRGDVPSNQPFWNGAENLVSGCAAAIRARGAA